MPTLLLKNADLLVTMNNNQRRIPDGGLFARDARLEQIGPTAELPAEADRVIDASGMIVLPGLVNTHHHLYQTLTRAVPAAQDASPVPLAEDALPHLGQADPRGRSTPARRSAWPS